MQNSIESFDSLNNMFLKYDDDIKNLKSEISCIKNEFIQYYERVENLKKYLIERNNKINNQYIYLKNNICNLDTKSKLIQQINKLKDNDDFLFINGLSDLYIAIVNTSKYPILEDYIDDYFKENPQEVNAMIENKTLKYYMPLFSVCIYYFGSPRCMEIFIKHGANVNFIDHNNEYCPTSLITAIRSSYKMHDKIDILLKYGADPNLYEGEILDEFCKELSYTFDSPYYEDDDILYHFENLYLKNEILNGILSLCKDEKMINRINKMKKNNNDII